MDRTCDLCTSILIHVCFKEMNERETDRDRDRERDRETAAVEPTVPGDVVLHVRVLGLPRHGDTKLQVESHAV